MTSGPFILAAGRSRWAWGRADLGTAVYDAAGGGDGRVGPLSLAARVARWHLADPTWPSARHLESVAAAAGGACQCWRRRQQAVGRSGQAVGWSNEWPPDSEHRKVSRGDRQVSSCLRSSGVIHTRVSEYGANCELAIRYQDTQVFPIGESVIQRDNGLKQLQELHPMPSPPPVPGRVAATSIPELPSYANQSRPKLC